MASGNFPLKRLLERFKKRNPCSLRSRIWRDESFDNFSGITPLNKFEFKQRITNDERFSPIHAGLLLERLFLPMSSATNLFAFFNEKGRFPDRPLLCKCKD
ncbi:hypothetical protein IHE45_01G021000 [Dioscorea alata]|uniref:Uncharacterized protein n=1 Tax=Dioscorea alata TaxID=55571 RepID=A0ACB7WTH7_DIOAL|nr:hypothetical protein IHE45_01G021000 [Dioscorea alata]